MKSKTYPSDLTDEQWELLKDFVAQGSMGRPRKVDVREVINAILYVVKTGCQWRALPCDYPNWKTVYTYFLRWRNSGKWKEVHDTLCVSRFALKTAGSPHPVQLLSIVRA